MEMLLPLDFKHLIKIRNDIPEYADKKKSKMSKGVWHVYNVNTLWSDRIFWDQNMLKQLKHFAEINLFSLMHKNAIIT